MRARAFYGTALSAKDEGLTNSMICVDFGCAGHSLAPLLFPGLSTVTNFS
jgi:hypothetical protein